MVIEMKQIVDTDTKEHPHITVDISEDEVGGEIYWFTTLSTNNGAVDKNFSDIWCQNETQSPQASALEQCLKIYDYHKENYNMDLPIVVVGESVSIDAIKKTIEQLKG